VLHCPQPLPVCASAPSPVSLCPGPSPEVPKGTHCNCPAPRTPMISPHHQPPQAIVPMGGQLGKFGGVYSTPRVKETLAALCRWAGESSRHISPQEARRGLVLLYLRNMSILISGISGNLLERGYLLWFLAAFQAVQLRSAVVSPSLGRSPWA